MEQDSDTPVILHDLREDDHLALVHALRDVIEKTKRRHWQEDGIPIDQQPKRIELDSRALRAITFGAYVAAIQLPVGIAVAIRGVK